MKTIRISGIPVKLVYRVREDTTYLYGVGGDMPVWAKREVGRVLTNYGCDCDSNTWSYVRIVGRIDPFVIKH